jgi:hypothetical protein
MIPMTANAVAISAHDVPMSIVILAFCYFQDDLVVPQEILALPELPWLTIR